VREIPETPPEMSVSEAAAKVMKELVTEK